MKRIKWGCSIIIAILVLFLAAQFILPRSTESVVEYSLKTSRCGIMAVLSETSASQSVGLDQTQMAAVSEMLSSISLRRTFEKGNVISHKDGFGWYDIAFSDENGQVFQPTMQVDSNGDVFIDCVKYEIVDEAKKMELMELLGTICGR